jgi:hypothetical protein
MSILILILGILILLGLTKIVNMYYNFYHIYKDLDNDERIRYFYNNIIVKLISKRNKTKKIFIFYILIPLIKINYLILSFLISLMHSLCELEFDSFMKKNGFSIQEYSHQEIDKILNFDETNINEFNEININEFNETNINEFNETNKINIPSHNISTSNIQICNVVNSIEENNLDEFKSIINNQDIENLIDEKLEYIINNQNNINLFKQDEKLENFINNKNNEKLENFIKNKNSVNLYDNDDNDENKIINIIDLMKDVEPTNLSNLIKINSKVNENNKVLKIDENNKVLKIDENNEVLKMDGNNEVLKMDENNEVLKMDDIDFGENLNNFINSHNEENNNIRTETNTEVLIIKTGKKKNKI